MNASKLGRAAMFCGLVATTISIASGLSRGKSPSVGWFVAGLVLFFGGQILAKSGGRE